MVDDRSYEGVCRDSDEPGTPDYFSDEGSTKTLLTAY